MTLAIDLLKKHEGYRQHVYKCPAGYLTAGYGRNLETQGLSEHEATLLLIGDIDRAERSLSGESYWSGLDTVRRAVLTDMVVNLGWNGFCNFMRMRAALQRDDYQGAADEMVRSRWYGQVGERSKRLEKMMRTGQIPNDI